MKTQDYAQEIGLESSEKKIKWPFAALIIAVLVGATWYGLSRLHSTQPAHDTETTPVSTPATASTSQ